ncbi:Chromo domain-containing protein [Fusarium sp. LHS14.1]|nr:Chromo domain-containing protein [Fusarium sp. LHS14.1]
MPLVSSDGQPSGRGGSTALTTRSRRSSLRSQRLVVDRDMVEAPQGVTTGGSDEEKVDGALGDDVYYVEMIKGHRFGENGKLEFQVKWKDYEEKDDVTWEPEGNLTAFDGDILKEYFAAIGGRPKEPGRMAGTKRCAQTTNDTSGIRPKRSRRSKAHITDDTSLATTKKWSPPLGSWEDEVENIDGGEEDDNKKLIIHVIWKNGRETKHDAQVIYKKCPQKMLQFYEARIKIVKNE